MSKLSHKRARLLIQKQHLLPEERSNLAEHLNLCKECRHFAATHRFLSQNLYLEAVRTRPAPEFKETILQQVQIRHRRNLIMSPIKTVAALAVLAVVLIFAWQTFRPSTEQPAAVSEAVSEAPTRTPRPTLTPLATRVLAIERLATSPEDLAGVWVQSDTDFYRYWLFNTDGTWSAATTATRERLENSPSSQGEFWFEGSKLYVEYQDGGTCHESVNVFEVQLLENGMIRFDSIVNECNWGSRELTTYDLESVELEE